VTFLVNGVHPGRRHRAHVHELVDGQLLTTVEEVEQTLGAVRSGELVLLVVEAKLIGQTAAAGRLSHLATGGFLLGDRATRHVPSAIPLSIPRLALRPSDYLQSLLAPAEHALMGLTVLGHSEPSSAVGP